MGAPVSFIVLAVALTLLATLTILLPVLRSTRPGSGSVGTIMSVLFLVFLGAGAFLLYVANSDWNWTDRGLPDDPIVQQLYGLQEATVRDPHSSDAFASLGNFYLRYGQTQPAMEALNEAYKLTQGRDPEINLSLVEALAAVGGPVQQARASELITTTLKLVPGHRKALWYGGELAWSLGQVDVAIARWQGLLDQTESGGTKEAQSVARLLKERIAQAQEQQNQPSSEGEEVQVTVALSTDLRAELDASLPVFVLARALNQPGPPLAVKRLTVAQLPTRVSLSDADAMLPSRKISQFGAIEIVARVSLSGQPVAASGDHFGAVQIEEGPREVSIVIQETVP